MNVLRTGYAATSRVVGVDNGPLFYLRETIQIVNGLTAELVGIPLYKHELDDRQVSYPAGENTHRYEDAHKTLYGYLIDGLDKDCMSALGTERGKTLKIGSKKSVEALKMLYPALENGKYFIQSVNLVACRRVTITRLLASKLSWPVAAKSCSPSSSIPT